MIKLTANYSKRLGLPGYSSHQFSICVDAELNNSDDVKAEVARLYSTLQSSVDQEIQKTGFVPEHGYGINGTPAPQQNGSSVHHTNGSSNSIGAWKCSEKQRDLILKLIEDHRLEKGDLQKLAGEMFGISEVSSLNKLQASGLIDRLIEENGGKINRRGTTPAGRFNGRATR